MDRAYWTKELQEAERELDAATGRLALNAAAKKLQRARAELKRLEAGGRHNIMPEAEERPKRPVSRRRGRRSAGASSSSSKTNF